LDEERIILEDGNTREYTYISYKDNDGASVIADLKKNYEIRLYTETEFDGTHSEGVVNHIVEGNSDEVTAPYQKTVNNRDYRFYQWANGETSNPIEITPNDNTILTAKYKGHLLTGTQTATALGTQRKIAESSDGTLHMVYVSSDKAYYTYSTDGGNIWQNEQQVSGSGTASQPCIASTDYQYGDDIHFVWQEDVSGTRYLKYRSLYTHPATQTLDSGGTTVNLQPVIAVSSFGDDVMIMYKKMHLGRYQLHFQYSSDFGGTFSGGPHDWGTPIIWDAPSIAWNPQSDMFMVSTGTVDYGHRLYLLTFQNGTWGDVEFIYYSSQVPGVPTYSQVAVDNTGRTHITWIGERNNIAVAMHKSYLNGSMSAINYFRDEVLYDPQIRYTSVAGHTDGNGGVSLVYTSNPSPQNLFNVYATDGINFDGVYLIFPSATITYPTLVEKVVPAEVTYVVTKGSSSPYLMKHQTRANATPGTYTGTLKSLASEDQVYPVTPNTWKRYRSIELTDTTTGGQLLVRFGNITCAGTRMDDFSDVASVSNHSIHQGFMQSGNFRLSSGDSVTVAYGMSNRNWSQHGNITLDLKEATTGRSLSHLRTVAFAPNDTAAFENEQLRFGDGIRQPREVYLSVRITGVDMSDIVVNHANGYLFNSGLFKQSPPGSPPGIFIPSDFALAQNYPNPFNPTTTITYDLPKDTRALVAVYDLAGRKVITLASGLQSAGRYQVQWDGTDNTGTHLSSGIYFYRLQTPDKTLVRKMLLLR